eukprot:679914-Hanusia_phi.AAC.2
MADEEYADHVEVRASWRLVALTLLLQSLITKKQEKDRSVDRLCERLMTVRLEEDEARAVFAYPPSGTLLAHVCVR